MFWKIATCSFSVFLIVSLSTVACELDSESDGGSDGYTYDDGNNDGPKYFSVRIDDLSEDCRNDAPGSDIDAVVLVKGGTNHYATYVEDVSFGECAGINSGHNNTSDMTGAPDGTDESGFCSLGGMGGYAVLSFDELQIENGDQVIVYEVGAVDTNFAVNALANDGTQVSLGNCESDTCALVVTGL